MVRGYDIAREKLGLHEVRNTHELVDFFKKNSVNGDIRIDPSRTPWCAAFVNACERAAGCKGTGSCLARSFLKYGIKVDKIEDARAGDIVIFKRGGSTWQGHVAYLDGIDKDKYGNTLVRTVGGNQSDSVSIGWYHLNRLIGIRRMI